MIATNGRSCKSGNRSTVPSTSPLASSLQDYSFIELYEIGGEEEALKSFFPVVILESARPTLYWTVYAVEGQDPTPSLTDFLLVWYQS